MNLFEILSNNERIIIFSAVEEQIIYTWNQSDTLQCWKFYCWTGWEEIDILTQSGYGPKTFEEARKIAIKWYNGQIK